MKVLTEQLFTVMYSVDCEASTSRLSFQTLSIRGSNTHMARTYTVNMKNLFCYVIDAMRIT